MNSKKCFDCKQIKPLDQFYHNASNKDGHSDDCKGCHDLRGKENEKRRQKPCARCAQLHNRHSSLCRDCTYEIQRTEVQQGDDSSFLIPTYGQLGSGRGRRG
jgi:hypothetical protein